MKTKWIIAFVVLLLNFTLITNNNFATTSVSNDTIDTGIWVRNYPTISKGLTQVLIKIRLTEPGNVYYVFYDSIVPEISANKIKSDVLFHTDTTIQKYGIINYPSVPGAVSIQLDGFGREQEIYLYMVTESNIEGLLECDIKYYNFSMHFKHKIVPIDSTPAPYGYLEYLPANYSKDSIHGFPLIVFLHGTGGTGNGHFDGLTNPNTCMREGLTRYLELNLDLPAIVISPQTPSSWVPQTLDAFIDTLQFLYNINANKIYITGISMGGGGAWQYALAYPQKIAAVVPLCGAWSSSASTDFSLLAKVPVWAFHNDMDPTVSVNSTYQNIRGLIAAGGHPFMSIFRSDDHSCAYEAYYYPHIWDWLFAQERGKASKPCGITNAYISYNSVVVDGLFDEKAWMKSWNTIPNQLNANSQFDALFNLLWDENYLYTGICLDKEIYFNHDKEITVYLNGNNDSLGNFDSYDLKFNFKDFDNSVLSNTDTIGIKYAWAESDTTYNLEFALPFNKTLYPIPIAGDGFGFDIQILAKDLSSGDQSSIFWNGNFQDSSDTRLFGNILLSFETTDQPSYINDISISSNLKLSQNYPNPFSQNSTIEYYVCGREWVTLIVYDNMGKEIKTLVNQVQNDGYYAFELDASAYSNGIYYYRLQAGTNSLCKKFIVLK